MQNWIIGRDKPDNVLQHLRAEAVLSKGPLIICFDYFDTLITRCVKAEHTKRLASERLSRRLKGSFPGEMLYQLRRGIEEDLCRISAEKNGELEFSFAAMAENLWCELNKKDKDGVVPAKEQLVREMLAMEVAVEKAVQQVCPEVFQLLQSLKRLDFTLLLVSDFYLPEQEFSALLQWHKLDGFFSRVYISSVCGRSKGSGRIFPMICQDLGAKAEHMLMIGDNPHADIRMAAQHGLRTMHLQRPETSRRPKGMEAAEPPRQNQCALFAKISLPKDSCFPEIGLSLWLFTHRLVEELIERDVHDVFFLSKEGEFLKRIFDHYQDQLFGGKIITSHYLLASRKATFIASLRPLESEDFSRLLDHYRDISIRDFLQSLNFEETVIESLCRKLRHDCCQRLANIRQQQAFRELLTLKAFRQAYESRRQQQRHNFLGYLDTFGVDYRTQGLHLVDVGWKGSIQDNIYYILSKETAVQGYYIGSLNATERVAGNRKKGLLFDNAEQPTPYFNVFNSNRSLFEMVLGAGHGSAIAYRSRDDRPADQAGPEGNPVEDGGRCCPPLVATLELALERQLFIDHIQPLQQKLFALNSEMNRASMIEQTVPDDAWFARHHGRMVFLPTKGEIEWFEVLYHYENFGIFEFTNFAASHNFSLIERLHHLKNIIKDPPVLESGVWPPIILRRFGVGFWQKIDGRRRYYREFGSLF